MGATTRARRTPAAEARSAVLLVLGLLLLVFVLDAPPVRAEPPVPMLVHGHAYDLNGVPLAIGTPIRAIVDGVVYSNDSEVSDAAGAYSVLIAGNWRLNGTASETPTLKEGADPADIVLFAAGDFTNATLVFQETIPWSPSAVVAMDLHLADPAWEPADVKIQAVVTQPARLDNPYVIVCNAYPGGVGLGGYYLQKDLPGSYDGPKVSLGGTLPLGGAIQVNVTDPTFFDLGGDALKLVFLNTALGVGTPAGGRDVPVDRVEFNATSAGTLDWEPGATIMGSAPAPGPGLMLNRSTPCGDTNSPQDFVLQKEAGLPSNSTVSVTITSPTSGQAVPGSQTFNLRWTLGSNTFRQFAYLRVWVNVSYGGKWVSLVPGIGGVQETPWDVPNIAEPSAAINVTVVDAFGARASQTVTFVIQLQSPWPVVLAFLIVIVVAVFLFLGIRSVRRSRGQSHVLQPPKPPEPMSASGAPPPVAPSAPGPPAATTKVCPNCGTQVKAEDNSCFFCGHLFVTPSSP